MEDHLLCWWSASTTEGFLPLREYIASQMQAKEIETKSDNILITNGSQQALDLLAKLFINPGDVVLVEKPSYLGALQVFRSYQARFIDVPTDDEGINIEALDIAIKKHHPKLIYVTPTFKNPTGVTLSKERCRSVAKIVQENKVPLIEDDPYGELRYYGEVVPPIKSFDETGWVIYLSTFSKTIAPGLRLGWLVAEKDLMGKLVLAKQGTDLHTGTLVQRAAYHYLMNYNVTNHVETIRSEYGRRRDIMLQEMEKNFPTNVSWTKPEGGMFLWVTLPENLDAVKLLSRAIEEKVAYVPGAPFYADDACLNTLRLNYSNATPDQIKSGIGRLANLFGKLHG